jgi:putative adhesin
MTAMFEYVLFAALTLAQGTQTDQTVPVQKGTRLDISNAAGEVKIVTWERDAVRVEADHSDRQTVDVRAGEQRLIVRGSSRSGGMRSIDYTISVPKWMSITVTGNYTDVDMQGVGGDVNVETTRGDINVSGGAGFISLKSVQGSISLTNAKGRMDIMNVNDDIHVADVSGDLTAGTTNGAISLERIDSSNVDAYTVNDNISYDGPIRDKGVYRLTSHNGGISLGVPDRTNATLSIRTYQGGFRSTFPVKVEDQNSRRRFSLTLGDGSARVEIETFNGSITLRRPGEAPPSSRSRNRNPR